MLKHVAKPYDEFYCNENFYFPIFHVHKNSQINHFKPIFKRGKFWGVTDDPPPIIFPRFVFGHCSLRCDADSIGSTNRDFSLFPNLLFHKKT